jgi:hypothetical protein
MDDGFGVDDGLDLVGPDPKYSFVSISSIALLNKLALSMVIRCPIAQFGCDEASASVAVASFSAGQSRKAPPEAVMITRSTAFMSSPTSAWNTAECSLSTGSTVAPEARAASSSSGPAVTRLSLLASASVCPCWSAFSPGRSPAAPTMADMAQSAGRAAASRIASSPAAAATPLPASASFSSA